MKNNIAINKMTYGRAWKGDEKLTWNSLIQIAKQFIIQLIKMNPYISLFLMRTYIVSKGGSGLGELEGVEINYLKMLFTKIQLQI